jgi:hypothetical protein
MINDNARKHYLMRTLNNLSNRTENRRDLAGRGSQAEVALGRMNGRFFCRLDKGDGLVFAYS